MAIFKKRGQQRRKGVIKGIKTAYRRSVIEKLKTPDIIKHEGKNVISGDWFKYALKKAKGDAEYLLCLTRTITNAKEQGIFGVELTYLEKQNRPGTMGIKSKRKTRILSFNDAIHEINKVRTVKLGELLQRQNK